MRFRRCVIAIRLRVCVGPLWLFFAGLGSCLQVRASGGSSLKEMSWAISASVLTLNVSVMLMTIGIIMTSAFMVPWIWRACLSIS